MYAFTNNNLQANATMKCHARLVNAEIVMIAKNFCASPTYLK